MDFTIFSQWSRWSFPHYITVRPRRFTLNSVGISGTTVAEWVSFRNHKYEVAGSMSIWSSVFSSKLVDFQRMIHFAFTTFSVFEIFSKLAVVVPEALLRFAIYRDWKASALKWKILAVYGRLASIPINHNRSQRQIYPAIKCWSTSDEAILWWEAELLAATAGSPQAAWPVTPRAL